MQPNTFALIVSHLVAALVGKLLSTLISFNVLDPGFHPNITFVVIFYHTDLGIFFSDTSQCTDMEYVQRI